MRMNVGVGLVGLVVLSGTGHAAEPAAQPRERRLHLASAEASSYLVNDWNKFQENYLPLYVGDDDPKTAWTLKTEGIGEWLRVHVTPMTGATKVRLKIRNGYQKSDKLWAANSRGHGLTVVLLPSKKTADVDLEDKSGWQEIAVELPAGPLDAVELRVRSVYAGKKYDDLVLSDVQVFVTATTPDNPAFEKERFKKVTEWKKERLEAVKLFATKVGQALPVAAQYVSHDSDGSVRQEEAKCKDLVCEIATGLARAKATKSGSGASSLALANELARARFATMTPVRISTLDKRAVPRIDGTCTPQLGGCVEDSCPGQLPLPRTLGYFNSQTLVTTEQMGLPALSDVIDLKPPQCRRSEPTIFAWVSRAAPADGGAPGQVRALLLAACGLVEGREGSYPSFHVELLAYGKTGQLDLLADQFTTSMYGWEGDTSGSKVAKAVVTSSYTGESTAFEAATAVAAAK